MFVRKEEFENGKWKGVISAKRSKSVQKDLVAEKERFFLKNILPIQKCIVLLCREYPRCMQVRHNSSQ